MNILPNRTHLCGDIGLNHNGNLQIAKDLIYMAKEADFDCVKFQKRDIDTVYTVEELNKTREGPDKTIITNRVWKNQLEFNRDEYHQIDEYCKTLDIGWTASPWDEKSLDFLLEFDLPYIKIASASVTDRNLLLKACKSNKPLFISTGMCNMDLIHKVVYFIEENEGNLECVYHCTSTYPCKLEEINLLGIKTLISRLPDISIGFSSHFVGPGPAIWAVAFGARAIEVHITQDRSMYGSDQAASLEPAGFKRMTRDIRDMQKALGDSIIKVYDSEIGIEKKLRRVKNIS